MANNRDEIINEIKGMSDKKYKDFQIKLCPNISGILGVRVPKLREYAKILASENWEQNYNYLRDEYYEELMIRGMMLGLGNISVEKRLEYLKLFIPKINNWAVCDTTCAGLKFTKKNEKAIWDFLQKYLKSNKEFEIRFAIVMLLDFFMNDEYIDKVIKIIDTIVAKEYYVSMAVAWTVSEIYIKYPEKGLEYLKNSKLDSATYSKAIQKIMDSYRVNKEDKIMIKKLKI